MLVLTRRGRLLPVLARTSLARRTGLSRTCCARCWERSAKAPAGDHGDRRHRGRYRYPPGRRVRHPRRRVPLRDPAARLRLMVGRWTFGRLPSRGAERPALPTKTWDAGEVHLAADWRNPFRLVERDHEGDTTTGRAMVRDEQRRAAAGRARHRSGRPVGPLPDISPLDRPDPLALPYVETAPGVRANPEHSARRTEAGLVPSSDQLTRSAAGLRDGL